MLERVQIGPAYSARERFNQRLARSRSRCGNVIDDELFASHYGSAHYSSPSSFPDRNDFSAVPGGGLNDRSSPRSVTLAGLFHRS
jgi:hypothetical protein